MVTAPLAETTIDNLIATMPGATKVVDGVKLRVDVRSGVGISLRELAKELVLHPIALPDSDVSEDFIIPIAGVAGALNFAYKLDQERILTLSSRRILIRPKTVFCSRSVTKLQLLNALANKSQVT